MAYGLLSVPCALFLISVDVLGLYSTQMSKPMHWTYILRTCIGVYPAQMSKLYSAQMSRLYPALIPKPSAQMSMLRRSRSILYADIYAFITRRFLNLYPVQMSRSILYEDV